jgi:hypothetical protein
MTYLDKTKQATKTKRGLNLVAIKHMNVQVTRLSQARNQRESRWQIQLSWIIF